MDQIALSTTEMREFSVPQVFCLVGEYQYLLGLGSVLVGTDMRIEVEVQETPDAFCLHLDPPDMVGQAEETTFGAWRDALAGIARDETQLDGLDITPRLTDPELACPVDDQLRSPSVAVALATAFHAHRGRSTTVGEDALAEEAGQMLEQVSAGGRSYPQRYDALCRACIHGGAVYVGPSADPINAQMLVPPESLVIVFDPEDDAPPENTGWETHLLGALGSLGGTEELLRQTRERGMEALFEMTRDELSDMEIAVLYALLRVRQMIQRLLESLDRDVRDNDRLAEVCDEESTILRDYFEFPSSRLRDIRQKAVSTGALGGKYTYAFGSRPALLLLAPGRRDEVCSRLADEYGADGVRRLNLDHAGIRSEVI